MVQSMYIPFMAASVFMAAYLMWGAYTSKPDRAVLGWASLILAGIPLGMFVPDLVFFTETWDKLAWLKLAVCLIGLAEMILVRVLGILKTTEDFNDVVPGP